MEEGLCSFYNSTAEYMSQISGMLKNSSKSSDSFNRQVSSLSHSENAHFAPQPNFSEMSENQARSGIHQKAEESKIRSQLLFILKNLKALHENNQSLKQDLAYAEYCLSVDNLHQASSYLQNILFNEKVDFDCRTIHNKILEEARNLAS